MVVDHLEQAGASGEFLHASESGDYERIRFAHAADGRILGVGDAACGRLEEATEPPRVVYLTGLAAQDLCAGLMVSEGGDSPRTDPST